MINTDRVKLLVVEDTFLIKGIGLVLAPALTSSLHQNLLDTQHEVFVLPLIGEGFSTQAKFIAMHLNIKNVKLPAQKRWNILIVVDSAEKQYIATGSTIFATAPIAQQLLATN